MNFEAAEQTVIGWGDSLVSLAPNFALAAIVLIIFYSLARLARRTVRGLGQKISDNKAVSNLFATFAYIFVIFMGLSIGLKIMNLDGAATSILAGAGIAGVAIGFAFQDIAANFIAGIVLALQRPFKIGDLIESHEIFGTVRQINLRSTEIETLDGQYVHIPNKDILLNPLTDYSHKGHRRIELAVGVSYATDLGKAETVAIEAVKSLKGIEEKKPVDLYYDEFADSAITYTIRFWVTFKRQTDYLQLRSDAIKAIKAAYDKEGITIPFPMRTLEIAPKQVDTLIKALGRK